MQSIKPRTIVIGEGSPAIKLRDAVAFDISGGKYEPDQSQAGVAVAKDGRRYTLENRQRRRVDGKLLETLTITRETPKVKGKAARKAEKRARRLARAGGQ